MTDRLASWLVTLGITALAFAIRFVGLAYPSKLVFDEDLLRQGRLTLWKYGFEKAWPDGDETNASVVAGNPDIYLDKPSFIVHPPVGKWLIGFGEQPLRDELLRLAVHAPGLRRPTGVRDHPVGPAALPLHPDRRHRGHPAHVGRPGLRDVADRPAGHLPGLLLVAAVACCVGRPGLVSPPAGRSAGRRWPARLRRRIRPVVWLRPWRLVAGILFGLAIGTKWNSVYVLA